MRIAKRVVILTSCLLTSASFSQSYASGAPTAEITSNVLSGGEVHLPQPSLSSPTIPREIEAESNLDSWLLLLLAAGLVVVELRRKQRILQAPRLASEAGESGIRSAA